MLVLVATDGSRKRSQLASQGAALVGVGVERSLDVLEEQQQVENTDILCRGGASECNPGKPLMAIPPTTTHHL